MKKIARNLFIALAISLPTLSAWAAVTDSGDGELRKVDAAARRVIISHGDWTNGNMAAMTMAMQVKEGVDLSAMRKGDRVKFQVVQEGRDWVVTDMRADKR